MVPVTKPFLPPKEEYERYIQGIWERNWLTNNGPLVIELESKLKEYLGVPHLLYVSNGTIALQIGIKALGLKGEIITTPFSYVATTSSIVWEGCTPVFVDIDPDTLNIDPHKIEAAITPRTTAIVATHVYGNPCDVYAIDAVAKKHNLKVIYDGAHAFGVKYKGKSIFSYGDVSTASFHATKLFHTVEGGAVFTQDTGLLQGMTYMRNFGHRGLEKFDGVGINGKNSEFHAAMGLLNLNYIGTILDRRKLLHSYYDSALGTLSPRKPKVIPGSIWNHSYFPLIFENESQLLKIVRALNAEEIFPRRYFYPSLETLPYVKNQSLPIVDSISRRVLCLPLYHSLEMKDIDRIVTIISRSLNQSL